MLLQPSSFKIYAIKTDSNAYPTTKHLEPELEFLAPNISLELELELSSVLKFLQIWSLELLGSNLFLEPELDLNFFF